MLSVHFILFDFFGLFFFILIFGFDHSGSSCKLRSLVSHVKLYISAKFKVKIQDITLFKRTLNLIFELGSYKGSSEHYK